ncbi:MAG: hypothetical protein KGH95_05965 [Thaumarchaeota archaeon]|nr:hypothetical protein [Nitrososphaerota archaeon]
MKRYFLATILIAYIFGNYAAFAEPIMLPYSDMENMVFDGKWTYTEEWKHTSWDGGIRSAHDGKFIYILVDLVSNTNFTKEKDNVMLCFDSNNTKSTTFDKHDYCFQSILGTNEGSTYQGNSTSGSTGNFEKISNPSGFISVSGISDQNDRYSDIPHPSYEFKIPVDFIGRSDIYGFYYSVYDANTNKFSTWPANLTQNDQFQIPTPNNWGVMVSPDKSLPEFQFPMIALVPAFIVILIVARFLVKSNYFTNFSH